MNERIKELYLQAVEYSNNCNTFDGRTEFAEKFAELIIKECACIADDMKSLETTRAIKEHFGVEE